MADEEEALNFNRLVLPETVQTSLKALAKRKAGVVLLSGPSGSGKAQAAGAVAAAQGRVLQSVDLAKLASKYIGETEKNLAALFDKAAGAGAVLFFDEADALFGKRGEVGDSHDRYANIELSSLLQRMEAYPGLVILATNQRERIDKAFLRRLVLEIDFPLPEATDRKEIWARKPRRIDLP